jgi:hypothetical protein
MAKDKEQRPRKKVKDQRPRAKAKDEWPRTRSKGQGKKPRTKGQGKKAEDKGQGVGQEPRTRAKDEGQGLLDASKAKKDCFVYNRFAGRALRFFPARSLGRPVWRLTAGCRLTSR